MVGIIITLDTTAAWAPIGLVSVRDRVCVAFVVCQPRQWVCGRGIRARIMRMCNPAHIQIAKQAARVFTRSRVRL